jgi:hypothetical protein
MSYCFLLGLIPCTLNTFSTCRTSMRTRRQTIQTSATIKSKDRRFLCREKIFSLRFKWDKINIRGNSMISLRSIKSTWQRRCLPLRITIAQSSIKLIVCCPMESQLSTRNKWALPTMDMDRSSSITQTRCHKT